MFQVSISDSTEELNRFHIESSAEMIEQALKWSASERAVVLGCGRCSEVPVLALMDHYKAVDLVDIDQQALQYLDDNLGQNLTETACELNLHHGDLTGLLDKLKVTVGNIVSRSSQPIDCLHKLSNILITTKPNFWNHVPFQQYNLVICSGVLTQLQAIVRKAVEQVFLQKFSAYKEYLITDAVWRKSTWHFARTLEESFINYLREIVNSDGVIYLSDTVRMSVLKKEPGKEQSYLTQGAWIITKTNKLSDYLSTDNDEILSQDDWQWLRKGDTQGYWGRLYDVQAIIYRPKQ